MTLTLLFLAGGALRFSFNEATVWDKPIRADARQYAIYGFNLSHRGVFSQRLSPGPGETIPPDSFRSPGYPLFLAGVFLLGDDERFYGRALLAQAILGSLLAPLTFLLGAGFLPLRFAAAAGTAVAFNPHLASIGGNLLTETLFALMLLLALIALQWAAKGRAVPAYAVAGALFGAAYLVNETALLLPFFLAAVLLWWWRRTCPFSPKTALRPLGTFLAVFLLFWGGWTLRCALAVAPGSSRTSGARALETLTHGTYIDFIYRNPRFREFPYREDPEQPAFGRSWEDFSRVFGKRFAERPFRYVSWYLLEKPYWLWSWDMLQGPGDIYVYPVVRSLYQVSPAANATREAFRLTHIPVLVVVLLGLSWAAVRALRRGLDAGSERGPLLIFAVLVYITAVYSLFACWSRYSIPARPELYLALAWTACGVSDRWRATAWAKRTRGS